MCKIRCEGIETLRLERTSGEAVVQISGGAPPPEGTGASCILCQCCKDADTERTGRLMEKQTGTKQNNAGKDCTRRLTV